MRMSDASRAWLAAGVLVLAMGVGLAGCAKKPKADKTSAGEPPTAGMTAMPMDHEMAAGMDSMGAKDGMDGMAGMNDMGGLSNDDPTNGVDVMEVPLRRPDAGVAVQKGNKGMMPKKRLADPTE